MSPSNVSAKISPTALTIVMSSSAVDARIDESLQADTRDCAGPSRSDIAVKVGYHPLRQVVGFDFVVERELAQFRHQPPVATDDALHQAPVPEVVESA